jgi:hypothetical protein
VNQQLCNTTNNKTDFHINPVLNNLAVINDDFLVLNPGTLYAPYRLTGAFYAFFDGIIKTFSGTGGDFTYFCDSHN